MRFHRSNRAFISAFLAWVLVFPVAPAAAALVWAATETIALTDTKYYRGAPDVAVQTDGPVHIVFEQLVGSRIKKMELVYRTNQSGVWTDTTITANTVPDQVPSISVDGGRPRIVYRRGRGVMDVASEIIYKTKVSGVWKTTRLSKNSHPDDLPRIAGYRNNDYVTWIGYDQGVLGDGDIYFKTNATPTRKWRGEKITNNDIEEDSADIAVGPRGKPHLTFTAVDPTARDREIFYATRVSGAWKIRRITNKPEFNDDNPSIAVYKNKVYIAFTRAPKDNTGVAQLFLATNADGAWRVMRVTKQKGGVIGRPRISVAGGVVRLVYTKLDPLAGDFDIFYRSYQNQSWQASVIADDVADSLATGLSAKDGRAHIVYESWDTKTKTGGIFYRRQQ